LSETKSNKKRRLIPLDVTIHLLCYGFVNLGLFFLNQIDTFYLWFIWPLTGWGIGLLIHISVRVIGRRKWSVGTKAFMIHFAIYLIMSLYLIFLDTFTGYNLSNPITWAYFPISAWFVALFVQLLSMFFIRIRQRPEETLARKRFHLINAFIVHLFAFLSINVYLLLVNLFTGFEPKWYLYPLAAMSMALLIHLIVTFLEIIPIKNIQLKILLYHFFIFVVVSGYLIVDDILSGGSHWWYWPVGGWFLGVILHLIYYFSVQTVKKSKSSK
jgi:hypothetical protein